MNLSMGTVAAAATTVPPVPYLVMPLDGTAMVETYPSHDRQLYGHTRTAVRRAAL